MKEIRLKVFEGEKCISENALAQLPEFEDGTKITDVKFLEDVPLSDTWQTESASQPLPGVTGQAHRH